MNKILLFVASAALFFSTHTPVQQTGSLEFSVRITPSGGRAEPVLRFPFSILKKSFVDIQKEAEAAEPLPDLDKFIEAQEISPELKAWVKKNHTVQFAGDDFYRLATVKDIFEVPEFYEAYLTLNAGDTAIGFPKPKFKESDRTESPARYEQGVKEYRAAAQKFLNGHPHSKYGMENALGPLGLSQKWLRLDTDRRRRIHYRTLELAGTTYLAVVVESDLDGRAAVQNLKPGEYWISTLEQAASAGDMRLRWDVAVIVQAGRPARIDLSNVNAVQSDTRR